MNFKNSFGEIKDDTVRITHRSCSGEFMLRHLLHLSLERKNNTAVAYIAFAAQAAALVFCFTRDISVLTGIYIALFCVLMSLIGFAFLAGHHVVHIQLIGDPLPPLIIPFAARREGLAFYEALLQARQT